MIPVGRLFRPNERQVAQLAKKDYLGKATVGGTAHPPLACALDSVGPGERDSRRPVPPPPCPRGMAFRDGNEDLADSKTQTLPVSPIIPALLRFLSGC